LTRASTWAGLSVLAAIFVKGKEGGGRRKKEEGKKEKEKEEGGGRNEGKEQTDQSEDDHVFLSLLYSFFLSTIE